MKKLILFLAFVSISFIVDAQIRVGKGCIRYDPQAPQGKRFSCVCNIPDVGIPTHCEPNPPFRQIIECPRCFIITRIISPELIRSFGNPFNVITSGNLEYEITLPEMRKKIIAKDVIVEDIIINGAKATQVTYTEISETDY